MAYLLPFLVIISAARIKDIRIEGVNAVPKKKILEILHIRKGGILRKPLYVSGILKLHDIYRAKGYFDFKVLKDSLSVDEEGAHIFIRVDEGKRKVVGSLLFNGVHHIDSAKLRRLLPVRTPFYYDESVLAGIETRLISFYSDTGFPFVDLSREITKDTLDTLEIVFKVDEGPHVVIKDIRIIGLKRVRRKIAEREILVKSGESYRSSKIMESKRRIYATGLFSSVRHYVLERSESGDTVDLIFSLEETSPRYAGIGLGVSTPNEVQAKVVLGHNNLLNNAQHLEITAEIFSDFVKLKRRRVDLNYSEPYLLGFKILGKTHLFYYRDLDRRLREWGMDVQIQKVITSYFRLVSLLGLKKSYQVETEQGPTINLFRIEPLYDSRDNLFYPERGIFTQVRLDRAGGILGGDNDFYRFSLDISHYRKISKGGYVLAFHVGAGDVFPYGRTREILLSEQFTLGGPGSIRGYARDEIGPNVYDDVHSGTRLLFGNLEIRKKVLSQLGFVVFLDGGGLWKDWSEASLDKNFALAAGVGIRIFTPVGPLSIDWGIKLKDRLPSDRGKITLFLGQMF